MPNLFWIGPRQSDISYIEDLFDGSVTVFGDNNNGNISYSKTYAQRINHNSSNNEMDDFLEITELELIRKYPDIRFMAYNPNLIFHSQREVIKHTLCLNDIAVMAMLNQKKSFREFARHYVSVLPYAIITGRLCAVDYLQERMPGTDTWVIQDELASGGEGTFLMNADNECVMQGLLQDDRECLVSPYMKDSLSVNMHAVVFDDDVLTMQGSLQVIETQRNRLVYHGSDFIAYQDLNKQNQRNFENCVRTLCVQIQKVGYRGVIGIDALIINDSIFVLEANNRFQASSLLVNKALLDEGLESLQEMNLEAFNRKKRTHMPQYNLSEMKIPYSLYSVVAPDSPEKPLELMNYEVYNPKIKEEDLLVCFEDGYDGMQKLEEGAYLCRMIFRSNIIEVIDGRESRILPRLKPFQGLR